MILLKKEFSVNNCYKRVTLLLTVKNVEYADGKKKELCIWVDNKVCSVARDAGQNIMQQNGFAPKMR